MTRAMFTVTVKSPEGGTSPTHYCANNLTVYDGTAGRQALAFICSGRLMTVPVEDVIEVKVTSGWSHCNSCDGPVGHIGHYPDEPAKQQA